MSEKEMKLSLRGDAFSAMIEDFDSVLTRTIGNMEMKGADEATITVKLGITLERTSVGSEGGNRNITRPSFKHDIGSVMQVKDKKSGALTGNYEIVLDEESGTYVIRRVEDGQMNMFDDEKDVIHEAEFEDITPEQKEPVTPDRELESREAPGIPEKASMDADDIDSPFAWLSQFIGKELIVVQSVDGSFSVIVKVSGDMVLTSGTNPRNDFYCPEELLKEHCGHRLTCSLGTDDNDRTFVYVRCADCSEILCSEYEPQEEDEDEDYQYEEPEG